MGKFKHILFSDQPYLITFDDYDGNPFTVEVPGEEIVQALRRSYALDKFLEDLDKKDSL